MTVDVSKLTGYGIVKPLAGGVGVSKLTGYAIVSPLDGGVGVSKLTGYAIVFEGLNATEIAIDVPFQSADLQLEVGGAHDIDAGRHPRRGGGIDLVPDIAE